MTHNVKTIDPTSIAIQELHGYLLAAVAPRPIAFASTVDREGNVNLSPFSYFNVFSANPPVMIFSPARRGKDNTTKHTFENIKQVPETVINIVNFSIVEQVSLASTEYDQGVNEFVKAGLTQVPSEKVKPPRVGESPVAFECLVDDVIELGQDGGAGNLIISRVIMIHIQEKYLDEKGRLDPKAMDSVGRMGGNWYCRATGEALFEIPKPLQSKGIGVDQLPERIRMSTILTGNNLGRLGNLEHLPDVEAIEEIKNEVEIKLIIEQNGSQAKALQEALHRLAQSYLDQGHTEKALKVLMIAT